jgi:hypothetical protein
LSNRPERRRRGDKPSGSDLDRKPWRLWDHIGVILGIVLGLIALLILLLVAAAGDPGAFGIIVVTIIGISLIFFGGQLHKSRRG